MDIHSILTEDDIKYAKTLLMPFHIALNRIVEGKLRKNATYVRGEVDKGSVGDVPMFWVVESSNGDNTHEALLVQIERI